MGISIVVSKGISDNGCDIFSIPSGNPKPNNFKIMLIEEIGRCVIVSIRYPDASNYEGIKVLLYVDVSSSDIYNSKWIDPHFTDDKNQLSPFARFEPTARGWMSAIDLARIINNQ